MTNNSSEWLVVTDHLIGSLPDSINSRRAVLTALVALMPDQCPYRVPVRQILATLDKHIIDQREFAFVATTIK